MKLVKPKQGTTMETIGTLQWHKGCPESGDSCTLGVRFVDACLEIEVEDVITVLRASLRKWDSVHA